MLPHTAPPTAAHGPQFALHSLSRHDVWHVLVGRRREFDWAVRWPEDEAGSFVQAASGPLCVFAFRHKPGDTPLPSEAAPLGGPDPVTSLAVQVLQTCLYGVALLVGAGALHIRVSCTPDLGAAEAAAAVQDLLPPARQAVAWTAARAARDASAPPPLSGVAPPPWVASRASDEGGGASTAAASLLHATPAACASTAFALGVACAGVLLLSGAVRMLVRRQQRAAARAAALRVRQRQKQAEQRAGTASRGKGSSRRRV